MEMLSIEGIEDLEELERKGLVSLTKYEAAVVAKKGEKASNKNWLDIRKKLKQVGFKHLSQGRWHCFHDEDGKFVPSEK